MHLLKIVYVPAIRRFQRCKATDAKTVTARTGPAMTYHCTAGADGAAERNKRILTYYGSTKNEGPEAKRKCSLSVEVLLYTRLLRLVNVT